MKIRLYEQYSKNGKKLKHPKDYGIGGLDIDKNGTALFFDSNEKTPTYPLQSTRIEVHAHGIFVYGMQEYGDRIWHQFWYGNTTPEALVRRK